VAEAWGPVWGSADAPSQILGQPEKGDIREEVGGSARMGEGESEGEKVQDVEADEQRGGASPQAAGGPFSPDQNGPLPDGEYLEWTRNADTAECGWCKYRVQTREHLFKHCGRWKMQQKIL